MVCARWEASGGRLDDGAALARLERRILFEETLTHFPKMRFDGAPVMAESVFINQLKTWRYDYPRPAKPPTNSSQRRTRDHHLGPRAVQR